MFASFLSYTSSAVLDATHLYGGDKTLRILHDRNLSFHEGGNNR
jgi:hypothetical protein